MPRPKKPSNPRKPAVKTSTARFERASRKPRGGVYLLRLYIAGMTPQSTQAVGNIKRICEEYLKGRYDLEIIDLYQQPTLSEGEQIIAAPTLIRRLPLPLRRLIGNMSETERVLVGLDLRPVKQPE